MAGVDFNAKTLYNEVQGSRAEFIQRYTEQNNTTTLIAEKMFEFYAGMEFDGTPGLSDEEYKQGLTDKKALKEIQRDQIYERFVAPEDMEAFQEMDQVSKQDYIANRIPHAEGEQANPLADRINALKILSRLNIIDSEIEALSKEIEKVNESEPFEADARVVDFLRPYLRDETQVIEFLKLPVTERVDYLKNHLAHTPETSDEDLKNSAIELAMELEMLETNIKVEKEALDELEKLNAETKPNEGNKYIIPEKMSKEAIKEQMESFRTMFQ